MISLGVSKRDYSTLLKALAMLEGYPAELFISSKFGDILSERLDVQIPEWVNLREFVPQQEIAKIYQKARFAILPLMDTTQTSAGLNLILEAGAFGKTVIATRNAGTEKLIQDGETGILVPPYDVHAMKDAIQRLWDNPELAIKMGTAARKHLVENYNPEKINHRINEIFLKIHRESQNN